MRNRKNSSKARRVLERPSNTPESVFQCHSPRMLSIHSANTCHPCQVRSQRRETCTEILAHGVLHIIKTQDRRTEEPMSFRFVRGWLACYQGRWHHVDMISQLCRVHQSGLFASRQQRRWCGLADQTSERVENIDSRLDVLQLDLDAGGRRRKLLRLSGNPTLFAARVSIAHVLGFEDQERAQNIETRMPSVCRTWAHRWYIASVLQTSR